MIMSKLIRGSLLLLIALVISGCQLTTKVDGRGVVTSKSGLFNCGDGNSQCSVDYANYTGSALSYTEELFATASNGHRFSHWSGDCSGTGRCTISINKLTGSKTVTAHFEQLILSKTNNISEFKFTVANNPQLPTDISGTIDEASRTISVDVPTGTNLQALVASFVTDGVSVAVSSVEQTTDSSINDFSNTVVYEVTAENGQKKQYQVSVNEVSFEAKELTSFSFSRSQNSDLFEDIVGFVDQNTRTIAVTLPKGTDVSALVATFETTGQFVYVNGVEQFSGISANTFTGPVTYSVVAGNQTSQDYVVTVTESDCLERTFNGDALVLSEQDLQALEGYTTITGRLVIGDYEIDSTGLTNLNGLSCIQSVGGLTIISNPDLTTLNGFERLNEVISGDILIDANPLLADVNALSTLTTIATVDISNNASLTDLSGLSNITITKALSLDSLSSLTALPLLNGLSSGAALSVVNTAVTNLSGLDEVQAIGALEVAYNPDLVSLKGIDSLTVIEQNFALARNGVLVDISASQNLSRIGGTFTSVYNASLCNSDVIALRDQILSRQGIGGAVTMIGGLVCN